MSPASLPNWYERLRDKWVSSLSNRHVASAEDQHANVRALSVGEVDAYFEVSDALAVIHTQLIIRHSKGQKVADYVRRRHFCHARRNGQLQREPVRDRPVVGEVRSACSDGREA